MPKLRMKSVRSFVLSYTSDSCNPAREAKKGFGRQRNVPQAKLDSRRVFQTPVICDTIEPVYARSPDPADDKEKMNEYPI
ncbi:MAG: hypothetical protein ACI4MM_02940 [Candidatus Ventricola sp.]